jgi:hypothetical protein
LGLVANGTDTLLYPQPYIMPTIVGGLRQTAALVRMMASVGSPDIVYADFLRQLRTGPNAKAIALRSWRNANRCGATYPSLYDPHGYTAAVLKVYVDVWVE